VATFDKQEQEAKIYIDGAVRATCSISDMGGTATDPLLFGFVSVDEWDGLLDDIAYYDYVLTPAAVAAHYGGDTSTYDYDGNYQVTAVEYPDGDDETFTYDAMGNRLTRVFNGSTTNYTYNAGERMTAAGGVTYVYDDNGNLTDRGANDDFVWDHENHLASTDIDSVDSTYDYNGDGIRTSRTIGVTTVDYIWDLRGELPKILEDGGGVRYVYGADLISRIDGSTERYYLADGLGSTTSLMDDTGAVTDTYEYDIFGNIRTESGSSANEFTYTGEQVDSTGLQYLRARYYDPAVGRFLSQDPLPFMQRYVYVGNHPINFVDLTGLCWGPDWRCEVQEEIEDTANDVADGVGDLIGYAAECLGNGLNCLPAPVHNVIHRGVDLTASSFYAVYYVAYESLGFINRMPGNSEIVLKAIFAQHYTTLLLAEMVGLGGNVAMDAIETHLLGIDEPVFDEGVPKEIVPWPLRGWFDRFNLPTPVRTLPGIHEDGTIDIRF
jgi:RHS repeat-associated protein